MMRKATLLLPALLLALLLGLAVAGGAALAEGESLSEWTFMLYMCGSDLESQYGLASYNLREIASLWYPEQTVVLGADGVALQDWPGASVNLLVETGGSKRWHSMEADEKGRSLGVDIAEDRLQRYAFDLEYSEEAFGHTPRMHLVDEQPLASMADPETLADFIRWGVKNYPAKKYGLLLWDHGGGSRTGLFVDELFGNDVMPLCELGDALEGGGAFFELVAIDACLMCSLETAQTLAPHALYLVASEEEAAGYGSAFADWINELYRNPGCDGQLLGCEFCDATQHKITQQGNALMETQLTYSVIYLDKIDALSECFDRLFDFAGYLYESYPSRFNMFCNQLITAETYGTGSVDMIDLGSFLFSENTVSLLDAGIRNDLVVALDNAVCYNLKGSSRSRSKGLSFCYAPDMTPAEMSIYARNCRSAPYLALLDAVMPDWQAPDWVYQTARRLTPMEDLEDYRMTLEMVPGSALPKLCILNGTGRVFSCTCDLYYEDDEIGVIRCLGDDVAFAEWDAERGAMCYVMNDYGHWPAIDGVPCNKRLIDMDTDAHLYNVPLQLDVEAANLRLLSTPRFDEKLGRLVFDYEALGLWPGYDEETRMPSRTIISFQQMQGREYRLLFPYVNIINEGLNNYVLGPSLRMSRYLEVEYVPLPEGVYYCRFVVTDVFRHRYMTDPVKLSWDGQRFTPME